MSSSQRLPLKPTHTRQLSRAKERRRISMELPERLKMDDDEDEDAAALDTAHPEAFVQQSMYGIIAAAHSKGSIGTKFNEDSGTDTDTETEDYKGKTKAKDLSQTASQESSTRSSLDEKRSQRPKSSRTSKTAESSILTSLSRATRQRSENQGSMTHSQFLSPKITVAGETGFATHAIQRDAPMLDRKIQARARADMETSLSSSAQTMKKPTSDRQQKAPVALPEALAEIFQFEEPEEVVSEYACWYLQSVLLQGYMYITQKHVCFYAYMQKKGNVIKSGHLGKQGKHNPRYKRYWFTLRGDVFSYFGSAADPYFPSGSIDLRYAVSAELTAERGQDKDTVTTFVIATDKRTYYFRADSASSAKEWVRQLQKVIFRSHNEGDSVKISLPLENIVDVEPTSVIELADTVKLRVIDNDETYAVDEYFFTFFSHGKDALKDLSVMTQGNDTKRMAADTSQSEALLEKAWPQSFKRKVSADRPPRLTQATAAPLTEPVRSTLSPMSAGGPSSPRLSGELTRRSSGDVPRASLDRGRTSFERGRQDASPASRSRSRFKSSKSPLSPTPNESSETYFDSSENTLRSPGTTDGNEVDMSASQLLTTPTLRMPQPRRTVSGSTVERLRSDSQELSPQSTTSEGIRIQPPTRTQTNATSQSSPITLSQSPTEDFPKQASDNKKTQRSDSPYSAARSLRAIATPFQHAFSFADAVRNQSKRMSSYLSSSPKNYYDKFSGAIAGGKRHYTEADGLATDDRTRDAEDDIDAAEHERRFQEHFALPETERLRAVYYCWLHRVLPLYGKIYISDRHFCFRSLLYGTRTKLVVPFHDIDNIEKERGFRWGYPGMVLIIRGHEELFFDFGSQAVRDDCVITVLRGLDVTKAALESIILTEEEKLEAEEAAAENELLQDARKDGHGEKHDLPQDLGEQLAEGPPVLFDDPNASVLDFRPKTSMRITCLTIGSRGDVQPYIALCKALMAHGHKVKIATHVEFENWIKQHGIEFAPVEGDPAELMRLCVELGMFTPSFILETSTFARGWLGKLLETSWKACQNTDLLIESPSAMGGIHIAEALGVPYFRAFTMPWTKTRAYPHAFATPNQKMGGKYNYMTYVIFENVFWQLTAGQINRWRRKVLKLKPTDLGKMQINKVPFLYNFSPSVVVPPLDFSDWIRVTGYWFLDEANEWTPPDDLLAFIKKAREDNMKLVYVGFGSVPVSDLTAVTRQIVDAVLRADVRCIFGKGWSDHFDKPDPNAPKLPSAIFQIRAVPHDWLFKQIDCAVHHGGAGTTGASLRAGLPTVIKPFFGDQFFFASKVEDLGVGIHVKKLTAHQLGKAIWLASHDERIHAKARKLGEQIRRENGVENAINAIYRDLEYAKTLIKRPGSQNDVPDDDEAEESWTFVENESDADITGASDMTRFSVQNQGDRQPSLGSRALGGRGF